MWRRNIRYFVVSDFRFGLASNFDIVYRVAAAADRERCKTVVLLGNILTPFVVPEAIPDSKTWHTLFAQGRYLRTLTRQATVWWIPGATDAFMARKTLRKAAQPVRVAKSSTLMLPLEGLPNLLLTTEHPQPHAMPGPWPVNSLLRMLSKVTHDPDVDEATGAARLRQRARTAAEDVPLVAFVHAARFPYAGRFDDLWSCGQVGPNHAIVVQPDGLPDCRIVRV